MPRYADDDPVWEVREERLLDVYDTVAYWNSPLGHALLAGWTPFAAGDAGGRNWRQLPQGVQVNAFGAWIQLRRRTTRGAIARRLPELVMPPADNERVPELAE